MAKDTILFDLDGTIVDTLPLIKETYQKVFEDLKLPWGKIDVMKLIGIPLREIGKIAAGEDKVDIFFDNYQKHFHLLHENGSRIFPEIDMILDKLHQEKFSLGVVTSKGRMGAELTLKAVNLTNYFNVVTTFDDTEKHKPHPEPVFHALKVLGKHPQDAVFVGDSPFDVESGNRAKVTTIAVSWGMASKEELKSYHPTYIVDSRHELLKLILHLRNK